MGSALRFRTCLAQCLVERPKQIFNGGHECARHCRLLNYGAPFAILLQKIVGGINDEWYAPIIEAVIEAGAVVIPDRVIQNGCRETIVLYEDQRLLKNARDRQLRTSVCKRAFDVHSDKRLVLHNED